MKTSAIVEFGFENLVPKPYRRDHNPFQKRLDRKLQQNVLVDVIKRRNGWHKPFQKKLERKPHQWLSLGLMNWSPNPIGVIKRRNGCYTAATLP
jgi:hypothetical protein